MIPWRILEGDARARLAELRSGSVHCVVTSPPYWGLRDYGVAGQLGLEATPGEYLERMVAVFAEVRRVIRGDGTLWLNMGDCYAAGGREGSAGETGLEGSPRANAEAKRAKRVMRVNGDRPRPGLKPKDLVGMPWRLAFALQDAGWWLRMDVIWHKPNPMPESIRDRPTKAHEYLFLLAKSARYYYDAEAISEPVQPDTPERLARAHSGYAPPGQRPHGGSAVAESPGRDRTPAGWDTESSDHRQRVGRYGSGNKLRDIPQLEDGRGIPNDHLGRALPWTDETGRRNARSVWTIATQPFTEAHFATFPAELPRRAIAAGTSQVGVCAECGAPRRRITRDQFVPQPDVSLERGVKGAPGQKPMDERSGWEGVPRGSTERETIGWRPGCRHEAPSVPAVVLDPFAGAGTTLLVANRLGREAIGIELNPDYAAMARARIVADAPLFHDVQ